MKIHRASTLGLSLRPEQSAEARAFSLAEADWVTLKRGDELVLVRAIGAQPDGSFIGEIFALGQEEPGRVDGVCIGDQVAFQAAHVFACETARDRVAAASPQGPVEESLRQADRLKEQFIAAISREGRHPFAPLSSTIRFLQAKAPQDLKFAMELLERQSRQVERVLNELLDLARIQSGTLQIKRRRVDLAWVLHGAIEEVRPLFDEKQQHFVDAYPQQRIELEADSARLTRIIAGLLNNASKFTPAGGHIALVVEREPDELRIKVKDSGVGVPESLRGVIFDAFVQAHTTNESREGLGIGLTLAKHIVALHEGTIELQSEGPGLGSEFVIRFRHAKPAAPE